MGQSETECKGQFERLRVWSALTVPKEEVDLSLGTADAIAAMETVELDACSKHCPQSGEKRSESGKTNYMLCTE